MAAGASGVDKGMEGIGPSSRGGTSDLLNWGVKDHVNFGFLYPFATNNE